MPAYNYYNATGAWLGTVEADDEAAALKQAQEKHQDAQKVEERPQHQGHQAN